MSKIGNAADDGLWKYVERGECQFEDDASIDSITNPDQVRQFRIGRFRMTPGLYGTGEFGKFRRSRVQKCCYRAVYLVNAPPASGNEAGPSAANTLPSASTATPSPAVPCSPRLSV